MEDIRTKRGVSDLEFKGIIDNFDEFNMISVNEELILLFESLHDFSFDELMYFEDPLHYENIGVQTIISQIDEIISENLVSWSLSRISKTSRAVLRLAVYELKFTDVPVGVAINEALEICKKYSTEADASFVNGVLASVSKNA